MIRIELIYGRRSFLGNLSDGISAVWLSVFLGVIAALVALYFIPFANLWSDFGQGESAGDEVAWQQGEETVLSPVASAQKPQAASVAKGAVILPPVETTHTPENENSSPRERDPLELRALEREPEQNTGAREDPLESALVLPPVGGDDAPEVVATSAAPVAFAADVPSYTTACRAAVKVGSRVASTVELGLLSCRGSGEYELSGTVANSLQLTQLERAMSGLLVDVSTTSSREASGRLYFFLAGRFSAVEGGELATLSPEQARRLFVKVEHWADQCGIDAIAFSKPTSTPLNAAQTRQRRRLVGTGSHAQIGAFLAKLHAAEETAALAELILNPVQTDGHSSAAARLSAAIDIVVGGQ